MGSRTDPGAIDLDIDSNNDNGTAFPDRDPTEDDLQDDPGDPGKFVRLNDDGDDTADKDQQSASPARRS